MRAVGRIKNTCTRRKIQEFARLMSLSKIAFRAIINVYIIALAL